MLHSQTPDETLVLPADLSDLGKLDAGLGNCGCITFGCRHLPDLFSKLQDYAHSLVCCLAAGPILDANAVTMNGSAGELLHYQLHKHSMSGQEAILHNRLQVDDNASRRC